MKKFFVAAMLLIVTLSFQSCLEDTCTTISTYYIYEPVFMTEAELRKEITLENARELSQPGKMYFYENMLFINEKYEGIHVYDNSDPSNPTNLGFIVIPGNIDMSIKDDILFADGLIDIMSIDISNLQNPTVINTLENVFEANLDPDNGYIVYYRPVETREEYDCGQVWFDDGFIGLNEASVDVDFDKSIPLNGSGNTGRTGVGGSTARMTIAQNYLYVVDNSSLKSINIDGNSLSLENSTELGWGIETIYPYQDKLFIGSETGMFIFSNSNPGSPEYLSEFQHWRACDPVVVEDNTAYVTLRDGSTCAGFTNQLDVIDISDILQPELIESVQMTNPHGLAIKNDVLYICEGRDGLKIFDASDDTNIDNSQIYHDNSFQAVDVIALSETALFIIGEDGFRQYDVTDKTNPVLLSTISVKNN